MNMLTCLILLIEGDILLKYLIRIILFMAHASFNNKPWLVFIYHFIVIQAFFYSVITISSKMKAALMLVNPNVI